MVTKQPISLRAAGQGLIDIAGQRFARLLVVRFLGMGKNKKSIWECRCDCGETIEARGNDLKTGRMKSCGCWRRDCTRQRRTSHGLSLSAEFRAYNHMLDRCYRKTDAGYANYGGRGISVCTRWRKCFENFYADMGEKPTPKHSLERIDVNKGYCPSNCKWADRFEQSRNRRNTKRLTFNGETMTISEWSKRTGIAPDTIKSRLYSGWSVAKALSESIALGRGNYHGRKDIYATPEFRAWGGMHQRCYNKRTPQYPRYGGRGIIVCERWRSRGQWKSVPAFLAFLQDMGSRPSPAHSLDRINNDGPYSPENCRWALASEQGRNRGTCRVIEYNGMTRTATEWAEAYGLLPSTFISRINRGIPMGEALLTPTDELRGVRERDFRG